MNNKGHDYLIIYPPHSAQPVRHTMPSVDASHTALYCTASEHDGAHVFSPSESTSQPVKAGSTQQAHIRYTNLFPMRLRGQFR
jgi:hypothetical protein